GRYFFALTLHFDGIENVPPYNFVIVFIFLKCAENITNIHIMIWKMNSIIVAYSHKETGECEYAHTLSWSQLTRALTTRLVTSDLIRFRDKVKPASITMHPISNLCHHHLAVRESETSISFLGLPNTFAIFSMLFSIAFATIIMVTFGKVEVIIHVLYQDVFSISHVALEIVGFSLFVFTRPRTVNFDHKTDILFHKAESLPSCQIADVNNLCIIWTGLKFSWSKLTPPYKACEMIVYVDG
ncbi:hypothetical protein ACJX0J_017289, partial [Zea mays]